MSNHWAGCIYRHQRPSTRVWLALRRLSRDRILTPKEVVRIGMHLSYCASGNAHATFKSAAGEARDLGMLRGFPLPRSAFHAFERTYKRPLGLELTVLDLLIREKQQCLFRRTI